MKSTFVTGLNQPNGIAFNGAGDLFEADYGSGNIYEFLNNDGTLSSTPTLFADGLNDPCAIAFNSSGDLYVTEQSLGTLVEITPGGSESTLATGLGHPTAIAIQGLALPVPEPSTWALTAIGGAALLFRRRKN